ncbi:phosphatidylinositol synthase [Globomyces pollinis-pini]|nr:phosphatidylinositol synthase [Globomyces pollinis-pini]
MSSINPVFLFVPNIIGYSRVLFALLSLFFMPTNPHIAIFLYSLSCLLDAADGIAARHYNQSSQFGAVLDMVTDRSTTACLLIHLATMYPAFTFVFQLLVSLDLSSHYMHMVASARKGKDSHKSMDPDTNYLMVLYYTSRPVLFLVCAGNELCFIFIYCLGWFSHWLLWLGLLISIPVCLFKQLMNVIQLQAAAQSLAAKDYADRLPQKAD